MDVVHQGFAEEKKLEQWPKFILEKLIHHI